MDQSIVVSLVVMGINSCGFSENHSFNDILILLIMILSIHVLCVLGNCTLMSTKFC